MILHVVAGSRDDFQRTADKLLKVLNARSDVLYDALLPVLGVADLKGLKAPHVYFTPRGQSRKDWAELDAHFILTRARVVTDGDLQNPDQQAQCQATHCRP